MLTLTVMETMRRSIQSYAKFSRFSELGECVSLVVSSEYFSASPSHKSCEFSPICRSRFASELHLTIHFVRSD
jgi:hypothetical protein